MNFHLCRLRKKQLWSAKTSRALKTRRYWAVRLWFSCARSQTESCTACGLWWGWFPDSVCSRFSSYGPTPLSQPRICFSGSNLGCFWSERLCEGQHRVRFILTIRRKQSTASSSWELGSAAQPHPHVVFRVTAHGLGANAEFSDRITEDTKARILLDNG